MISSATHVERKALGQDLTSEAGQGFQGDTELCSPKYAPCSGVYPRTTYSHTSIPSWSQEGCQLLQMRKHTLGDAVCGKEACPSRCVQQIGTARSHLGNIRWGMASPCVSQSHPKHWLVSGL